MRETHGSSRSSFTSSVTSSFGSSFTSTSVFTFFDARPLSLPPPFALGLRFVFLVLGPGPGEESTFTSQLSASEVADSAY